MQNTLMQQGVELMLFGMGTVFIFLAVLVVATGIMSSLVERFSKPEPVALPVDKTPSPPSDDGPLIAVISAAIHQYRSRRR